MAEEDKTLEERKAAIKRKRDSKRDDQSKLQLAQEVTDLEALDELEDEYGFGGVKSVLLAPWTPGQPTRAFFKRPTPAEYKRYRQTVASKAPEKKTKEVLEAQDQLARSVLVYPKTADERQSLLDVFPGVIVTIAIAAAKFAEAAEEDEGKD